jgi:hypothetical protein
MSYTNAPYSGRCVSCNRENHSELNKNTGLPEDMCYQCRDVVAFAELTEDWETYDDNDSVIDDLCHIHGVERAIKNPRPESYNFDDMDGVDFQQEYLPHEYN